MVRDHTLRRLEAILARSERKIYEANEQRAAAERAANFRADRAEIRLRRKLSRAPIGFFGSLRFLGLLLGGGMVGAALGVLKVLHVPIPTIGAVWLGIAWLIVIVVLLVDFLTWRVRLPFRLDGYEHIDGTSPAQSGYVPWIDLRVEIHLCKVTAESERQRNRVLDLLAARIEQMLLGDKNANCGPAQAWSRKDEFVSGQVGNSVYSTRLIERWLRRDVRRLAKAYPVDRVVVVARYTGSGYYVAAEIV